MALIEDCQLTDDELAERLHWEGPIPFGLLEHFQEVRDLSIQKTLSLLTTQWEFAAGLMPPNGGPASDAMKGVLEGLVEGIRESMADVDMDVLPMDVTG